MSDTMLGFSEAAAALGISKQGLHAWVHSGKIAHATDTDGRPMLLITGKVGRPSRAFAIEEVERAARANGRGALFDAWLAERRAARKPKAARRSR